MKHLLNSVMLFLLLFIGQNAWGQTVVGQGDLTSTITWKLEQTGTNSYALTVSGTGDMPDFASSTAMPWNDYCRQITEVNISSGITKIGDYAFSKTAITSTNIPSVCTIIGRQAFASCKELKEIYIPASVTSIRTWAFALCNKVNLIHYDGRCTSNTTISLSSLGNTTTGGKIIEKEGTGSSVFSLRDGWEYYTHGGQCKGGAWVAESGTGDTNRKLFFYAQKSGALVNYVENKTATSTYSPECHPWCVNCEKYSSLEINRNVSSILSTEFMGFLDDSNHMTGYKNIQTITVEDGNPSYVVGAEGALYNKAKTKILLYPAKSTATHVDVPETVTDLGECSFFGAKNLQSITFLGTITRMSNCVFAEASSLNYMEFATGTAPKNYSKMVFFNLPSTGKVVATADTDAWKTFTSTIGSGWTFSSVRPYISSDGTLYVEGEGEYTTSSSDANWYSQRSSIKKIVVKEGITDIGSSAFANCSNVTEVTLNNSGTVGTNAFRDCSALTHVNIGGVKEFKYGIADPQPFYGCSKLSTINTTDLKAFCSIVNLEYLTGSGIAKKTLLINGVAHSSTSVLEIPEGVTEISKCAFRYFSNVTKIKFPSSIETIGIHNFAYNPYLKEITIPFTEASVGAEAFRECTSLETVTLNNTGTIGTGAFCNCSALTRVNIGGVKGFEYGIASPLPFYGCSKLSTINTTDLKAFCSIENLEYLTGSGMAEKTLLINGVAHSSTSVLEIPEGVTEISECAFRYFSNVTKIKFPSSIETIGIHNFAYNPYLKEITIPFTEASVGAEAFRECTSLETVTLNNTGTIGTGAFCNCSALTRVNIGGVKGFEYGIASPLPFYGCSKLSTINTTDLKAFCAIENLEYLTGSGMAEKTLLINGYTHSSTSVLEIPEGVTEIANYAFRYFSNVTKIKFPSSIETIGFQNFAYNPYLKEITIPLTKASVGNQAFRGCTSLESVTLNNSGTIGDGAFLDCTSLTRVNIGGVKGFAKPSDYSVNPFSRCSKLATINVTDLKAFCAIENLQYLTDSNYGTAANKTLMIDGVAHPSTSNLVIPEGVTSISPCAFRYFPNVVNIKLPESMKTISSSNFADHPYLEKIILPSTLTSVGKNAFSGCTNLMRIICRATTCPSVTGSIATNPYHIILKVPAGKASLYRAADIWKEFSVSESLYRVVSMNLSNYGNPDIAGYRLVANLYDDKIYRVKNWTSTNTDIAIVNTIGRVYAEDYIYDGSTELPYKEFSIIGDLGDCDTCVWNMKLYPRQVTLTDGNVYKSIKKFNCSGRISYTRTFADKVVNKWQCFYVPFDVEVTDELLEDFDFAELYMVSYFDADENGEIEDGEPLRMTFCRLYAGKTLHANTPYYVRVKSSGTKTFETTNATLMAAANGSVDCSTTKHVYSLVGIYEPTYMQGRYGMALNGGFTYVTNPATKLGAYRWYMEVKSRTGELENLARPIEIYVEGDEETTGIVALEDKVSAPQSDKVFTLDGRQVNNTDNLPSGMYIINGKKVFKK